MLPGPLTASASQSDNQHEGLEPTQDPARHDRGRGRAPVTPSENMASMSVDLRPQEAIPAMALDEIKRLLRLQKYQKRKCHRAQENLRRLLVAASRTNRVSCASRAVQVTLADCIRLEDKKSFAKLFNAFEDACTSCLVPDQPEYPEPELTTSDQFDSTASFLDGLTPESRTVVIDLLTRLRYDPEFIADRLERLSPKEIHALLPGRALSRSNESIFGGTNRAISRTSRPSGDNIDPQADVVRSQGFGSLLEILIHCPRASSAMDASELEFATDTWASVCARLIAHQSSGTERLVASVLNVFAHVFPWSGKARLEIWILRTLREGAFLLEQPVKQSFRARIEGGAEVAAKREARNQAFYTSAAEGLLELLSDCSEASVIPSGALTVCQAILSRLQPESRRLFPQFAIIKWLFPCFLIDAISLPEVSSFGLHELNSWLTRDSRTVYS